MDAGSSCDYHTVKALDLSATPHGDMGVLVGQFTDVRAASAGAAQLVQLSSTAQPPPTVQAVSGIGDSATLSTGSLPDQVGGGPWAAIVVQRGAIVLWITVGLVDKSHESVLPGEMKNLAITALSRLP